MEQKIYNEYVEILKEELLPAMGCTEPIAVAYAAAVAVQALGEKPESVEVNVSANIIKNVKSVVVPCTGGLRGIGAAVCAGIVAGCPEKELEILEEITGEQKVEMKKMLDTMPMTIRESDKEYIFDIQIKVRLLLNAKETVISFFRDDLLQKLSGLLLDHKIHIHEGISKTLRKQHADGALSGRRHSDHQNIFFLHNLCLALLSVAVIISG